MNYPIDAMQVHTCLAASWCELLPRTQPAAGNTNHAEMQHTHMMELFASQTKGPAAHTAAVPVMHVTNPKRPNNKPQESSP